MGIKIQPPSIKLNKTIVISVLIPLGMFAFGFALIPLYDVFCRITGLNGKISLIPYESTKTNTSIDDSRSITVQFTTTKNNGMPWDFSSNLPEITLHPGEIGKLDFIVKNTTEDIMIGQIIPSISPSEATDYLHKLECFCFTSQYLNPLEQEIMPLRIVVDKELPKHITKITLLYTLFDVTNLGSPK